MFKDLRKKHRANMYGNIASVDVPHLLRAVDLLWEAVNIAPMSAEEIGEIENDERREELEDIQEKRRLNIETVRKMGMANENSSQDNMDEPAIINTLRA